MSSFLLNKTILSNSYFLTIEFYEQFLLMDFSINRRKNICNCMDFFLI